MKEIPLTRVTLEPVANVVPGTLRDLVAILRDMGLANSAQEQLWVISLDNLNGIRAVTPVSIGTYHDTFIALPTVFSPVLLAASDRFIIAHNHPAGRPTPTPDDIDLTARIEAAAEILDIHFDDHLILAPDGTYTSMARLGYVSRTRLSA